MGDVIEKVRIYVPTALARIIHNPFHKSKTPTRMNNEILKSVSLLVRVVHYIEEVL